MKLSCIFTCKCDVFFLLLVGSHYQVKEVILEMLFISSYRDIKFYNFFLNILRCHFVMQWIISIHILTLKYSYSALIMCGRAYIFCFVPLFLWCLFQKTRINFPHFYFHHKERRAIMGRLYSRFLGSTPAPATTYLNEWFKIFGHCCPLLCKSR